MGTSTNSLAESGRATLTFSAPLVSLGKRLAIRARRLWVAYRNYRRRRGAVLMMQALDDRTLKDIGLTRSEIEWAVSGRSSDRLRSFNTRLPRCRIGREEMPRDRCTEDPLETRQVRGAPAPHAQHPDATCQSPEEASNHDARISRP
jgi:uncharacterized protein YjiS (DUF1127 family)